MRIMIHYPANEKHCSVHLPVCEQFLSEILCELIDCKPTQLQSNIQELRICSPLRGELAMAKDIFKLNQRIQDAQYFKILGGSEVLISVFEKRILMGTCLRTGKPIAIPLINPQLRMKYIEHEELTESGVGQNLVETKIYEIYDVFNKAEMEWFYCASI